MRTSWPAGSSCCATRSTRSTSARPAPGEDAELEAQLRAAEHAETIARSRRRGGRRAPRGRWRRRRARRSPSAGSPRPPSMTSGSRRWPIARRRWPRRRPSLRATPPPRRRASSSTRRRVPPPRSGWRCSTTCGASTATRSRRSSRSARPPPTELERLENQEGERERLRAEEVERAGRAGRRRGRADRCAPCRRATGWRRPSTLELPPLGLPAGAFGVELEPVDAGPVRRRPRHLHVRAEPRRAAAAAGRIASGGEASRVSLALKVVLAAADETPLLVFDEVDAGVGGRNAVGARRAAEAR